MKRSVDALKHDDGVHRCPWAGLDPIYVAYHDEEWGVPEYDDRALFEKLILDGFQAGLSWITILRKRDNFRQAFSDFDPEKIARYTPKKVERLMQDAGIIRNRAKIEGTVKSARLWLDIQEKGPGFSHLLWDRVDGNPASRPGPDATDRPAYGAHTPSTGATGLNAADRAMDRTRATGDTLADKAENAWDRTKQGVENLGHRAADAIDDTKDRVDGNPASRPGPDATDRR